MKDRFLKWWRWVFRRGVRSSIVLNMRPHDHIIGMVVYRQYLVMTTAGGEMYFLDGERLVEFSQAEIHSVPLDRSGRPAMNPDSWG